MKIKYCEVKDELEEMWPILMVPGAFIWFTGMLISAIVVGDHWYAWPLSLVFAALLTVGLVIVIYALLLLWKFSCVIYDQFWFTVSGGECGRSWNGELSVQLQRRYGDRR